LDQMDGLGFLMKNEADGVQSYALTEKGQAYLVEFRKIKRFGDLFGVDV
jgi:DNA-binding PadR family transcriptional regulator